MVYKSHIPGAPLGHFVEGITFYEGLHSPNRTERFLPNGGIELVIDLTPDPKYTYDETGTLELQKCTRAWVSGIRTGFITITAGDGGSMMLVFFKPHAARLFFGIPLSELTDTVVDADLVFGTSVLSLRQRILEKADPDGKVALVQQWLMQMMNASNRDTELAAFAADRIVQRPCSQAIDLLARDAGISHKHLISVFKRTIGVTPKQFQRIHRFQRVLRAIESGRDVNWTDVALDCGFYDQAHFAREFRHFSGLTPSGYLSQKGDLLNYVPIS